METTYLKRTLTGLSPADEMAAGALAKFKVGDMVKCDLRKPKDPRSLRQHRLYWKLCSVVQDNTDGAFKSAEEVSDYLKIQAGHCDVRWIQFPIKGDDGEVAYETIRWPQPRSISFTKMGQQEFHEYFHEAMDIVCVRIIPGMNKAELEAEIHELLGEAA